MRVRAGAGVCQRSRSPARAQERIVLITTSKTTRAELSKYMPEEHIPPHVTDEAGSPAGSPRQSGGEQRDART